MAVLVAALTWALLSAARDLTATPAASPTTERTLGPVGPRLPSGAAMPKGDLPGWRQTFAEDFPGRSLGKNWVAYEGQPQNDPGGYFSPSRVMVGDGVLTIGAWPDPARRGLYVSGGVSNKPTFSQTYGRMDIRFRMQRGTGIAYALLLWPTANRTEAEIDIAEDNGHNRDVMYAAMHTQRGDAHVGRDVAGDFTTWHTAGVEWSPGLVAFTLDGRVWSTIRRADVPSVPMSVALQTQAWDCANTWQACPGPGTPPRVDLQVDWVVAYQRATR